VNLHELRALILLLILQASYETLAQSLYFVDPEAVPDQDLDSAAQQQHQDEMSKALHAHMLRRTRSEVSSFVPPRSEVVLPVMMTQRQRECYKAHLARAYEVLTDPKTPRQNSHRGGQLRAVCASLKKVCISLLMIQRKSRQSNKDRSLVSVQSVLHTRAKSSDTRLVTLIQSGCISDRSTTELSNFEWVPTIRNL